MVIRTKDTNEIKKERAERLKEIRLLAGMTQKQFAANLGMSREGYQKLECGYNNISLDVLEGLKRVYGVSADYLLYGELQEEEQIWDLLSNCSETTRLEVLVRLFEYFSRTEERLFGRKVSQLIGQKVGQKDFDLKRFPEQASIWEEREKTQ